MNTYLVAINRGSSLWGEPGVLLSVFVHVTVDMFKRLFRNRSSRSKTSVLDPDILIKEK